jgi:Tol biopolymer transport system component
VAQPFDLKTMTLQGKPVSLAQNVEWYLGRWLATFSAGNDTLVYRTTPEPKRQLLGLLPSLASAQPVSEVATFAFPAVSPDGLKVIVNRWNSNAGGSDLWMLDLDRSSSVRLSFQGKGTMDDSAAFSPDGQRIVLVSSDAEGVERAWVQPVGGGAKEMLRADSERDFVRVGDWSPDGQSVVVSPQRAARGFDIELIRLDGKREAVPLLNSTANESWPRIAPSGRWMAYDSDESGRSEVYVTDFPAAKSKWQVSTGGGATAGWSADGETLYYVAGKKLVAAAVHEGNSFSSDPAKPVEALGDGIASAGLARNSGRIIAVRELDSGEPPMTVVLNWRRLLEKE